MTSNVTRAGLSWRPKQRALPGAEERLQEQSKFQALVGIRKFRNQATLILKIALEPLPSTRKTYLKRVLQSLMFASK